MTKLIIIADDLTGALDSGVAFANRGARVVVARTPNLAPAALATRADIVAISTNSRDGTEAEAIKKISLIHDVIQGSSCVIFKKIDSRLKGHIGAEVQALIGDDMPLFVAPAIPNLDRFCKDGCVYGTGIAHPIPIRPLFSRPVSIPDTDSDAQLLASLPQDLNKFTYCGASGLAFAISHRLFPGGTTPIPTIFGPCLMAIGSRDPITLRQLQELDAPIFPAPNGQIDDIPQSRLAVAQLTQAPQSVPPAQAGQAFSRSIARAITPQNWSTLFACGGETAAAIMAELGVGLLQIDGEILPGVPVAHCLDTGPVRQIITKSGGFGPPETLVTLARAVRA